MVPVACVCAPRPQVSDVRGAAVCLEEALRAVARAKTDFGSWWRTELRRVAVTRWGDVSLTDVKQSLNDKAAAVTAAEVATALSNIASRVASAATAATNDTVAALVTGGVNGALRTATLQLERELSRQETQHLQATVSGRGASVRPSVSVLANFCFDLGGVPQLEI